MELAPWHAEDLPVGVARDLGRWRFTAEEIVDFGARWDPLPFHVDPDAAAASPFGGLVASGIHTLAALQRLLTEGLHRHTAIIAGRGSGGMRLPHPTRAGAVARASVAIAAIEPYRDDRALALADATFRDEADGALLLEVRLEVVLGRRGRS